MAVLHGDKLVAIVRWGGAAVAALVAAVWVWSLFYFFDSTSAYRRLGVGEGMVFCHWYDPAVLRLTPGQRWDVRRDSIRWWFLVEKTTMSTTVFVPLWAPFAVAAVPTALVWRCHLRRQLPGGCVKCGYDRSGLAAGSPCPECGKA